METIDYNSLNILPIEKHTENTILVIVKLKRGEMQCTISSEYKYIISLRNINEKL